MLAGFASTYVAWGLVAKGSVATRTVAITAKDPDKLELTNLRSSDPRVKPEIVGTGSQRALKLTLTASDQLGPFTARVVVSTNLAAPHELQLSVSAEVANDLVFMPRAIFIPDPARAAGHDLRLRVYSLAGRPFTIKKANDEAGLVRVTMEKKEKEYHLTIKPLKSAAGAKGVLKLTTDRKDQPVLEVPLTSAGPRRAGPLSAPLRPMSGDTQKAPLMAK